MTRREIPVYKFVISPVDLWLNRWFLLTAGDISHFNTMTVAWGSIGGMWNKPMVQVVVRPTRYTWEFMEKYDTFTLSSFPVDFKTDLMTLGSVSGRDGNKLLQTGLTVNPSRTIDAPSFVEADLVIECRKIYTTDFKKEDFIDRHINEHYPKHDYHRVYFGEIKHIEGKEEFLKG